VHRITRETGVEDSPYKLSLLKRHGCRLIFNGHDEVLAAGLLMGADGAA